MFAAVVIGAVTVPPVSVAATEYVTALPLTSPLGTSSVAPPFTVRVPLLTTAVADRLPPVRLYVPVPPRAAIETVPPAVLIPADCAYTAPPLTPMRSFPDTYSRVPPPDCVRVTTAPPVPSSVSELIPGGS